MCLKYLGRIFTAVTGNPPQTRLNIPSCSIHYSEHIKRNPSSIQEEQSENNPIIRSAKALLE